MNSNGSCGYTAQGEDTSKRNSVNSSGPCPKRSSFTEGVRLLVSWASVGLPTTRLLRTLQEGTGSFTLPTLLSPLLRFPSRGSIRYASIETSQKSCGFLMRYPSTTHRSSKLKRSIHPGSNRLDFWTPAILALQFSPSRAKANLSKLFPLQWFSELGDLVRIAAMAMTEPWRIRPQTDHQQPPRASGPQPVCVHGGRERDRQVLTQNLSRDAL